MTHGSGRELKGVWKASDSLQRQDREITVFHSYFRVSSSSHPVTKLLPPRPGKGPQYAIILDLPLTSPLSSCPAPGGGHPPLRVISGRKTERLMNTSRTYSVR